MHGGYNMMILNGNWEGVPVFTIYKAPEGM